MCPGMYFASDFSFPCSQSQDRKSGSETMASQINSTSFLAKFLSHSSFSSAFRLCCCFELHSDVADQKCNFYGWPPQLTWFGYKQYEARLCWIHWLHSHQETPHSSTFPGLLKSILCLLGLALFRNRWLCLVMAFLSLTISKGGIQGITSWELWLCLCHKMRVSCQPRYKESVVWRLS